MRDMNCIRLPSNKYTMINKSVSCLIYVEKVIFITQSFSESLYIFSFAVYRGFRNGVDFSCLKYLMLGSLSTSINISHEK